ncbi:uncharacterized protein LAESUDRAFT_727822 [Laetiporus sulphureus 93-53]|uniref:Uncharacterized protein n=1 Tax=Laetiporus sulphureus 93-53 TaxID=1314785 RepID=A0A165DDM2_9APHY|nr:uncharacterized protein LAESUDRAFT_727822 [Laetiporus sulphureus 93-53]KZT04643.1 hypothetical protein LAESUDRAFT_727822 [Laetiporus sulphureus 93-53]
MSSLRLRESWSQEKEPGATYAEVVVEDMEDVIVRPRRKNTSGGCCGRRCGFLMKVFGVVCLLGAVILFAKSGLEPFKVLFYIAMICFKAALWVSKASYKAARWYMTRAPNTVPEGMPEYSTALGCSNVSRVYKDSQTTFTIQTEGVFGHLIDIEGSAVGTLTIANAVPDSTEIKYEATLRSNDLSLLDLVTFNDPSLSDSIEDLATRSRMLLRTPVFDNSTGSCMRYDMTAYIPSNVSSLDIRVRGGGAMQLKFDEESNFTMGALSVNINTTDERNLVLPHKGVHADVMDIDMALGWLVGDIAILNETKLGTEEGNMTMFLHVYPAASYEDPPAPAKLNTSSGTEKSSTFFYMNDTSHSRRAIHSTHRSHGPLLLIYGDVKINGTVNITAGLRFAIGSEENMDGPDRLVAQSDGLVFATY